MISTDLVLKIHNALIIEFGGEDGIRDIKLLESAINRPFQTFDGKDLYPSPEEKSAALLESIINNHPFIDGNKRIGYAMLVYFLLEYNLLLNASQNDKYDFILNIASGNFKYDKILYWIKNHTRNC